MLVFFASMVLTHILVREQIKAERMSKHECDSYCEKLRGWVDRIYYANIAMNNAAIANVVKEIAEDGYKRQHESHKEER